MVIHHGSHFKVKDMKTLFVVADVHSFFNEMCTALDDAGFDINNDDHIFVSCGDLLDRGPYPAECLYFVNSLPDHRKKLILGNHEELMLKAIYSGSFTSADIHNGTAETVYKLTGIRPIGTSDYFMVNQAALNSMMHHEAWYEYIHSCDNYYETDKYIFVHGWIPILKDGTLKYNEDWRDEFADWEEARWLNGMDMWNLGIKEPGKTIVCGHWHSSYGHAHYHNKGVEFSETDEGIQSIHTPFYDDGLIAIDSCVAYSGFVNCLKLEVEDE